MSDGDRTPEERLASIETLMLERHDTSKDWRDGVDKKFDRANKKLDTLLKSSHEIVTISVLSEAFAAHAQSCPARTSSNPDSKKDDINGKLNGTVNMMLKGYRGLGVMGSLLVVMFGLIVVICKLTGVF